jgi:hypothetical protein
MTEDERKREYEYHFKCADFEVQFKGNEEFMQAMIRKYEPKVLIKLNQLVPGDRPPAAVAQPPAPTAHPPALAAHPAHPRPEQALPPKADEKPGFAKKRRRRGGRRHKKPDLFGPKPGELPQKREPDDYLKHTPTNAEISGPTESGAKSGLNVDAEEIRSLNDRFRPQTSHDRVMIAAYYLEQKFPGEFSSPEVQQCYGVLSDKLPANLSTVLNNATRSGFLSKEEKAGKVRYRLTFKGKRYVENGLRLD